MKRQAQERTFILDRPEYASLKIKANHYSVFTSGEEISFYSWEDMGFWYSRWRKVATLHFSKGSSVYEEERIG